ncbi:MAG: hypothetical protein H2057_06345 [Alphaproteobacteria bacterium]|nr:hypothetical protein [Alphaproteobacteria bacterium]
MRKISLFLGVLLSASQCSIFLASQTWGSLGVAHEDENGLKKQKILKVILLETFEGQQAIDTPLLTPLAQNLLTHFKLDGTHTTKPLTTMKELTVYRRMFRNLLRGNEECLHFVQTYYHFLEKAGKLEEKLYREKNQSLKNALSHALSQEQIHKDAFCLCLEQMQSTEPLQTEPDSPMNLGKYERADFHENMRRILREKGILKEGVIYQEGDQKETGVKSEASHVAYQQQDFSEMEARARSEAAKSFGNRIREHFASESMIAFPVDFNSKLTAYLQKHIEVSQLTEEEILMRTAYQNEQQEKIMEILYIGALFLEVMPTVVSERYDVQAILGMFLSEKFPELHEEMRQSALRNFMGFSQEYIQGIINIYDAFLKDDVSIYFAPPKEVRSIIADMFLSTACREHPEMRRGFVEALTNYYSAYQTPGMLEQHAIVLYEARENSLAIKAYERALRMRAYNRNATFEPQKHLTLAYILPELRDTHQVASLAYCTLGEYDKALSASMKVLLSGGCDPSYSAYAFATIFLRQKQYEKAKRLSETWMAFPKGALHKNIHRWMKAVYRQALQGLAQNEREKTAPSGQKLLEVLKARQEKVLNHFPLQRKAAKKNKRSGSPPSKGSQQTFDATTTKAGSDCVAAPVSSPVLSQPSSSIKENMPVDEPPMPTAKGPKIKTKGTADPARARAIQVQAPPQREVEAKPLAIEEILKGGPLDIFNKLFLSLDGKIRSSAVQISLDEIETLMKALKQSYKKDKGKGSHAVAEIEMGDMHRDVITLAKHAYLKPYQWKSLRDAFVARGLYPRESKELLLKKHLL